MKLGTGLVAAVLSLGTLAPQVAKADALSLSLTSPSQGIGPGSTAFFSGTLSAPTTNTGNVYLNGDSFTVVGPFQIDDTAFFLNAPLFLTPGQSVTVDLFSVYAPAFTGAGNYTGDFTILAGANANDYSLVASDTFALAATPEPSSLLLLGTGIATLWSARRMRKPS